MFKAVRITLLLFLLFFVAVSTWLTETRSTDWNNSLWVKLYPINADGSAAADEYIASLEPEDFRSIEEFIASEVARYGRTLDRPVRIELGEKVHEQPPAIRPDSRMPGVMLWSLRLRWWASAIAAEQDDIDPDIRIFVRYHSPGDHPVLDNSVGLRKGMVGVVNAYANCLHRGRNSVIIAHELLHTLGATDKYDPGNGQPLAPDGLAEPDRIPLYPQRFAEIMGGRIALAHDDAVIPRGLRFARIGPLTASEIRLTD